MQDIAQYEDGASGLVIQYRRALVSILFLVLLAVASYQYYLHHLEVTHIKAANVYEKMMSAVTSGDVQSANSHASEIRADYPRSSYSEFANLVLAHLAIEKDDLSQAKVKLNELVTKDNLSHIAVARLARILLEQDKASEALSIIDLVPDDEYKTLMEEIRGDIFYSQGDMEKARKSYHLALKAAPDASLVPWLRLKLDDLGGDL